MTPFWKEERQGYNTYQNEEKQFFLALTPPYTLNNGHMMETDEPVWVLIC